jgi:hypothetical protein
MKDSALRFTGDSKTVLLSHLLQKHICVLLHIFDSEAVKKKPVVGKASINLASKGDQPHTSGGVRKSIMINVLGNARSRQSPWRPD